MMTTTTRLMLLACMSLTLVACQKEAAPVESAVDAPLTAPTSNDDMAWQAYVSDVVTRNLGDIVRSPYVYYLPAQAAEAAPAAEVPAAEAPAAEAGTTEGEAAAPVEDQAASIAEVSSDYSRLLEKASMDIARGILEGNMLAFASPDSAKMADLVVASFAGVEEGKMEGVRLLFIGDAVDNDRVKAAVEPSGVTYVFVEAK